MDKTDKAPDSLIANVAHIEFDEFRNIKTISFHEGTTATEAFDAVIWWRTEGRKLKHGTSDD